jgi:hypothetical protein
MMGHVQVNGTELKARIEKAIAERKMKKLITNLAKELDSESSFLPYEVETRIRKVLLEAGVEVSKLGGWYRCIAAYLLLPRLDELLEVKKVSNAQSVAPIVQRLRNEALRESLSAFGVEMPTRYARTSNSTGRRKIRIPREKKQQLVKNFLDAIPTFEALQDVLNSLPTKNNPIFKQIQNLVNRYFRIANHLQTKIAQT